MKINRICIIANTIIETGMSGGNRIFIECSKRWLSQGIAIDVFTSDVGETLCIENGLTGASYLTWISSKFRRMGVVVQYLIGTLKGCFIALKTPSYDDNTIVYSSSDFWPDFFPGLLMSRKLNCSWVASLYLFAPVPFKNQYGINKKFPGFSSIAYYQSQRLVYWLIKKYANMVFVTHEPDRSKFIDERLTSDRVIAVKGGVDLHTSTLVSDSKVKYYDAVFIGRFHSTKGVLELIDIWNYVCNEKSSAKLAMIGIGELEGQIRKKITKYNLDNNVDLLGFLDGIEKIKIFKKSRISLYPSVYDHWSMAPVEAMSCGLPLVTFDIKTLKHLHPKGMIRTPCYDLKAFAEGIIKLLSEKELHRKTQQDAIVWASEWDWDKKSEELLVDMEKYL